MLVSDADLTPTFVAREVIGLLTDRGRLDSMAESAARVGHADAARRVAEVALDVARGRNSARKARR